MIEDLYRTCNRNCYVKDLVTDDDSTLRQCCSAKEKGGELADENIQTNFLTDPGRRCKTMVKKYLQWSRILTTRLVPIVVTTTLRA